MNSKDETNIVADSANQQQHYVAPAIVSAVKVTDVVRGGTGFASDGGNFLPL